MAEKLARLIGGRVVYDPDPHAEFCNPWRTYAEVLRQCPPDATHLVVIQDDATPCVSFQEAATAALSARPDDVVLFFVAGRPWAHARAVLDACTKGLSWVPITNQHWCPAICVGWPVRHVQPILDWVERQNYPPMFRADDEILGRYLQAHAVWPLATVPSLVEHEDMEPSLLDTQKTWQGMDEGRVAACWIHPDCDPLSIDWRLGP